MATAYFFELITRMTKADSDQEHIEILLHSRPQIPDRTRSILGEISESPLPELVRIAAELKGLGAEIIAVPCITSHFFINEIEKRAGVHMINTLEETALCLEGAGVRAAGILATTGTVRCGVLQRTLEAHNIDVILPSGEDQEGVMSIIYDYIKAGKQPPMEKFQGIADRVKKAGANVLILGCTELPLIKQDRKAAEEFPSGCLDMLEVLARAAVLECGSLKDEYRTLI